MTKRTRKTGVLISLFCYLAVSSVAAVHAFPMIGPEPATPQSQFVSVGDTTIDIEDCHSPHTPPCEQSSSSTCKIFCAAMAQAIPVSVDTFFGNEQRSATLCCRKPLMVDQPLNVEPRPPK